MMYHCGFVGCPYQNINQHAVADHESITHLRCPVCGKHFIVKGMRRHLRIMVGNRHLPPPPSFYDEMVAMESVS